MGNLLRSAPSGPPEALSAAVAGDLQRFRAAWADEAARTATDAQGNNVLHALFSCQSDKQNERTRAILELIHASQGLDLQCMYAARSSALGCNPIWILVAYGNVGLLQHLRETAAEIDVARLVRVPNLQGDTAVLATCSKGSVAMLQYLALELLTDSAEFTKLLQQGNSKGTTPLEVAVAGAHLELVRYLAERVEKQSLLAQSSTGLSVFHVCCERNFADGLEVLLAAVEDMAAVLALKDKNGASCLHVAAFCRNREATEALLCCGLTPEQLDLKDGEGRTAYWLAMLKGAEELASSLKKAGASTELEGMQVEIDAANKRRAEIEAQRRAGL